MWLEIIRLIFFCIFQETLIENIFYFFALGKKAEIVQKGKSHWWTNLVAKITSNNHIIANEAVNWC